MGRRGRGLIGLALILLGMTVTGCASSSPYDKFFARYHLDRHYVQKGFGRKYSGDSTKEYIVGIGDTIQIASPGLQELTFATRIGPDGSIEVPIPGVDRVKVAGLTAKEIESRLSTVLARYFRNVSLVVTVPEKNSKRIFVTGQVRRGGIIRFEGNQIVLDVLARSTPAAFAETRAIIVWRADPQYPEGIHVNLDDIIEKGDTTTNILLREDDIVYVPITNLGAIVQGIVEAVNIVSAPVRAILTGTTSLLRLGTVPFQFQGFDELADRAATGRGGFGGFGGGRNNQNNFF